MISKDIDGNYKREFKDLLGLIRRALRKFGEEDSAGGDYFVVDRIPRTSERLHLVQIHRLHMLRPEVIQSLPSVLQAHPEWKIAVFVLSPEEFTIISPEAGLIVCNDGIIDALDRSMLPKKYHFVYEGSRPPPKGFKI